MELYRLTGAPKNYDVSGFWYCVALLAQSTEACAQAYLLRLARLLIEQGPGPLHILRRIVLLLSGLPRLHQLDDELAAYYERIFPTLVARQWMEEAGIHTSYQICLRNEDNSIHGQWDERDGYLLEGSKWLMKNE